MYPTVPTIAPGVVALVHGRQSRTLAAAGRSRGQLRQAEVQDLDETVLRHHDVLGLQVPMHDAGLMRSGQALANLRGDLQQLPDSEAPAGEQLPQRRPLHALHRDVGDAVRPTRCRRS